jgi:hypothetical protein
LHAVLGPQAEAAAADLEQAGGARLKDLEPAAIADTEFGHTPNPARVAAYLCDIGPFARGEEFDGEEAVSIQEAALAMPKA